MLRQRMKLAFFGQWPENRYALFRALPGRKGLFCCFQKNMQRFRYMFSDCVGETDMVF